MAKRERPLLGVCFRVAPLRLKLEAFSQWRKDVVEESRDDGVVVGGLVVLVLFTDEHIVCKNYLV